ncbi:MAG: PEP-CTERM sorting domain-containing protein [Phycisphaeraceae bacterium]
MNLKTTLFGTSALLLAASTQAATFGGSFSVLADSEGNLNPGPMRTIAIIDVDGNGLDLEGWDGSSFLPGSGDVIVTDLVNGEWDELTGDGDGFEGNAAFAAVANGVLGVTTGYSFVSVTTADNTPALVGGGDDIYLMWFPGLDPTATAPGLGQEYGFAVVAQVPNEVNGSIAPIAVTFDNIPATFGETVPEPTSLALMGLGGLLIARRRRQG